MSSVIVAELNDALCDAHWLSWHTKLTFVKCRQVQQLDEKCKDVWLALESLSQHY